MKEIQQFIKNPLGIFALFVTFIDGIAGLVISANFDNLNGKAERLPLIWFIIGFPILILIAFVILVIKYNEKLYAPKDFDNQEGFLIANGKSIKPHEEPKPLEKPEQIPLDKNKKSWSFLSFSSANLSVKQSFMIQDAALQRYSEEHDMEIKTEVQVAPNFFLDGVAENNGEVFLFEVKTNYISSMFDSLKRNVNRINRVVAKNGWDNIHIVLILVTKDKLQSDKVNKLKEQLNCVVPNLEIVNYLSGELSLTKKYEN